VTLDRFSCLWSAYPLERFDEPSPIDVRILLIEYFDQGWNDIFRGWTGVLETFQKIIVDRTGEHPILGCVAQHANRFLNPHFRFED
jgi:hypothetical protein